MVSVGWRAGVDGSALMAGVAPGLGWRAGVDGVWLMPSSGGLLRSLRSLSALCTRVDILGCPSVSSDLMMRSVTNGDGVYIKFPSGSGRGSCGGCSDGATPSPRSPMGVAVGRGVGTLSVAGVFVCSTGSPCLMMRSHPEGDGVEPTSPARSGRGDGWNGSSGVVTPSRRSPRGVETNEGVAGPELLVEADWGGVYIGTFSITHKGLLRAKRILNAATCDADLVPTDLANSLLYFQPVFLTASLNRSTSASDHLFPPFFVAPCDEGVSVAFALGCSVAASWANVAETAA